MKNFLAVDTSNNHLAVLAAKAGKVYSVFLPDCAMKHSVSVMPAVEEVLKKADMRLEECDFFAAVVGAGSFTGIRIGVAAVKGLALANGKSNPMQYANKILASWHNNNVENVEQTKNIALPTHVAPAPQKSTKRNYKNRE